MFYGRDKYEGFQDTTPLKHFVISFLLSAMDTHAQLPQTAQALEALKLLGVSYVYEPMFFDEIRSILQTIKDGLPAQDTPPYVPENEPVFLLRSADPMGAAIAQNWVDTAIKQGVSADRVKSATEQVERMKSYHEETRPSDLDD